MTSKFKRFKESMLKLVRKFKLKLDEIFRPILSKSWHCLSCLKNLRLLSSFVLALLLAVLCYFANNWRVFSGESMSQYFFIQKVICDNLGWHDSVDYGEVAFYNTAYDKELITAIDPNSKEFPDTLGVTAITDRKKILKFLELLSQSNQYDFVILNVSFDKNDVTPVDDSLYAKINNMERIVVAYSDNVEMPAKLDTNKTALSYYYATDFSTSLARYRYTDKDRKSIPMYVFQEKHPEIVMKRRGALYSSGSELCQNSIFLTFDDYMTAQDAAELQGNTLYMDEFQNLGSFLNNTATEEARINELARNTKGKIVIVSNIISNTYDTYLGKKPAALIIARAIQMLEEKKNIVPLWYALYWFAIFFIITCLIVFEISVWESLYVFVKKRIPEKIKKIIPSRFKRPSLKKFFFFVLSLLSYGAVLFVGSVIEYAFFDRVCSLIWPLAAFAILKLWFQFKKFDLVCKH